MKVKSDHDSKTKKKFNRNDHSTLSSTTAVQYEFHIFHKLQKETNEKQNFLVYYLIPQFKRKTHQVVCSLVAAYPPVHLAKMYNENL